MGWSRFLHEGSKMQQRISVPVHQWVSVNALSQIPIGDKFEINNISTPWIFLRESSTQPPANWTDGIILTSVYYYDSTRTAMPGSLEIWAYCNQDGGTMMVQEM